jgi:hypothetical protein
MKQMLKGHLNYFAVSGNHPSLWWFFNKVKRLWLASLKRRQPKGTPQLGEVHPVRRPLLSANQNYTPAALSPLRRQNPREEPGALAAHAGICAGGEEKSSSLPRPSSVMPYSITLSARIRSEVGSIKPRALAVLRLMYSSYRTGCCTGRSAGLAP